MIARRPINNLGARFEAFGGTGAVRSVEINGRHGGRPSSNRGEKGFGVSAPTRINRLAFSLLELLVVIAIISVVSTLAITSISGIQRSTAMTSSASQLLDYLATGRQAAMTLNQPVTVYCCLGITNDPPTHDALLLYRTDNGTTKAVERELKLSERVVLATNNTNWSSVLTPGISSTNSDPKGRTTNCYSFRFMPDGSTDLGGTASPTLTLVYRTDAASTTLPANFFTLQIDQQTGTVRTFRPQ